MQGPPYFRPLVLAFLMVGGLFFALAPEVGWQAGNLPIFRGDARLPDPPPAPPTTLRSAGCDGFDQQRRWFVATLYVGSYDDGDTYSTTCFRGEDRLRVRVAHINTADRDDCPVERARARTRALELIGGHRPHTAQRHWLYIIDWDRYGRPVAHVALGKGQVNEERVVGQILLTEGLAEPAPGGRVVPYTC